MFWKMENRASNFFLEVTAALSVQGVLATSIVTAHISLMKTATERALSIYVKQLKAQKRSRVCMLNQVYLSMY